MTKTRRKLSAVKKDFLKELARIERYDSQIQERFSASSPRLTKHQLHLITEALFFRLFRVYEGSVRDIFILYCQEKKPSTGKNVTSFINPRNFVHAEEIIKSNYRYLQWANPDDIIKRAELYLKDGFPLKQPFANNRQLLHTFRIIRNHIAHDSEESMNQYMKVIRNHFGGNPLKLPSPGEFLLLIKPSSPTNTYYLLNYIHFFKTFIKDIT